MRPPTRQIACVALLSGALVASGLLFVRALALAAGAASTGDLCSAVFHSGCDDTLRAPSSTLGGVPLAAWGVIHFTSLLGLLALGRVLGEAARETLSSAAALLALLGGLASAALVAVIVAGIVAPCPLCLLANGLSLAAVVPAFRWGGRPARDVARDWSVAVRYLAGGKLRRPDAAPLRFAALACSGLLAIVLYQWALIEWDRAVLRGGEIDPAQLVEAFSATPEQEIPLTADDPALGPATARATLVVFSDAFCPACRGYWRAAPQISAPYRGDLRMVFKHFPLDPPCNAAARSVVHPYACRAGLALEAARRQGKFWQYQTALESPGPGARGDVFRDAAVSVGLDLDRFGADMADPMLKQRLEADVALGVRLGVTATPTMFLNGRRIDAPSPRALAILLDHVLR